MNTDGEFNEEKDAVFQTHSPCPNLALKSPTTTFPALCWNIRLPEYTVGYARDESYGSVAATVTIILSEKEHLDFIPYVDLHTPFSGSALYPYLAAISPLNPDGFPDFCMWPDRMTNGSRRLADSSVNPSTAASSTIDRIYP
jgi:hypothetical protein